MQPLTLSLLLFIWESLEVAELESDWKKKSFEHRCYFLEQGLYPPLRSWLFLFTVRAYSVASLLLCIEVAVSFIVACDHGRPFLFTNSIPGLAGDDIYIYINEKNDAFCSSADMYLISLLHLPLSAFQLPFLLFLNDMRIFAAFVFCILFSSPVCLCVCVFAKQLWIGIHIQSSKCVSY